MDGSCLTSPQPLPKLSSSKLLSVASSLKSSSLPSTESNRSRMHSCWFSQQQRRSPLRHWLKVDSMPLYGLISAEKNVCEEPLAEDLTQRHKKSIILKMCHLPPIRPHSARDLWPWARTTILSQALLTDGCLLTKVQRLWSSGCPSLETAPPTRASSTSWMPSKTKKRSLNKLMRSCKPSCRLKSKNKVLGRPR